MIRIRRNRVVPFYLLLAGIVICAAARSVFLSVIVTVSIWICGVFFSLLDVKKRFVLFSFHIGFFVFLFGGVLLNLFTADKFAYLLGSEQAKVHTAFALSLSLGIVDITALLCYKSPSDVIEDVHEDQRYENVSALTKQVILCIMIISYVCELVIEIVVTRYRLANSYLSLEADVKAQLPAVITLCASVFYIAFFSYLATMPTKKATIFSFLAVGVLEGIILISGERGEPLSTMFALVFYVFLRNDMGINDIKIKKVHVFLALLFVPLMLSFLQSLASTRVNREYESSTHGAVYDFFETQGKSVTIISRCYDAREEISVIGGNTYVVGEIRNYLKTNLLSRLLFGNKVGSQLEQALSGDKFSATTNYLFLSSYSFNRNVGGGTTYIAEVYHDGGYVLLVIANFFLSLLIYNVDTIKRSNSILSCAIAMNIIRYLVLIPRGYMLAWFTDTFAVQNLMFMLLVVFINQRSRDS